MIQVKTKKRRWPLSRGLMAETLQAAGVGAKRSLNLAAAAETELLRDRVGELSAKELKRRLARALRRAGLPGEAARLLRQTASFEDITVHGEGNSKAPFSRGVLARNLEAAGLEMELAQSLATGVARDLHLGGVRSLSKEELSERVRAALSAALGEQEAQQVQARGRSKLRWVQSGHRQLPFSKGLLTASLLSAGVGGDQAREIAAQVQSALQLRGRASVGSAEVRALAEHLLLTQAGPEAGERYRALHLVRHPPRPLLVLIGGVTGSGKSTLASLLLSRLGITRVVSSDAVREVMRAMVSPALAPALHASSFEVSGGSDRERMAGFQEQARNVSVGLQAIAGRSVHEGHSLILEGVHLTPAGLMGAPIPGAITVPMLLAVEDEAEHRAFFRSREAASERRAEHYLEHFAAIRAIQTGLLREARAAGVPVLNSASVDRTLEEATDLLLQRVLQASGGAIPAGEPAR